MTTIKNYTTLKRLDVMAATTLRLTTIKNYTTLKLKNVAAVEKTGLTTIKNYTTLKPCVAADGQSARLTTIKNYTTLKPQTSNLGLSDSLHTTKTGRVLYGKPSYSYTISYYSAGCQPKFNWQRPASITKRLSPGKAGGSCDSSKNKWYFR